MNQTNTVIRSRFKLLLITWIGCYWGKHLKWLGYFEEAECIKSKHGHILGWINPINLLDVISHEHREILYRLFGESMGIANALDAESDKLESEYHLLRNAFTSIIPDSKMISFDNMFKAIMSLRYRTNKK